MQPFASSDLTGNGRFAAGLTGVSVNDTFTLAVVIENVGLAPVHDLAFRLSIADFTPPPVRY